MRMVTAALVVTLSAQVPGWPSGCARCGMASYVDIPATGDTVDQAGFYIAGWGIECESGEPANRVDVFYQGDDGFFVPLGGVGGWSNTGMHKGLWRPDVQTHYAPSCPSVTGSAGWHFYFAKPIPKGTRTLSINVWHGAHYQKHERTVTIR